MILTSLSGSQLPKPRRSTNDSCSSIRTHQTDGRDRFHRQPRRARNGGLFLRRVGRQLGRWRRGYRRLAYRQDTTNPFFGAMEDGARTASDELGIDLTVAAGKADGDEAT